MHEDESKGLITKQKKKEKKGEREKERGRNPFLRLCGNAAK